MHSAQHLAEHCVEIAQRVARVRRFMTACATAVHRAVFLRARRELAVGMRVCKRVREPCLLPGEQEDDADEAEQHALHGQSDTSQTAHAARGTRAGCRTRRALIITLFAPRRQIADRRVAFRGRYTGCMVRRILIAFIDGYKLLLSPFFGSQCRFYPTCSSYAREAIAVHGALRGTWLAAQRIVKCGPWHPGGVDPVPPAERK